jgi:hypothetical protein
VAGRNFLLPRYGEARLVLLIEPVVQRNEMDFSGYAKFTGESSIQFGDVVERGR